MASLETANSKVLEGVDISRGGIAEKIIRPIS